MERTLHQSGNGACSSGFTLVELLVVVALMAVLSGLLLPAVIRVRDRAREVTAGQEKAKPKREPLALDQAALPAGLEPLIESADLKMGLASNYHRIGLNVYTRYRVDCTERIVFRHPGGTTDDRRVLLVVPFPENAVEARDVQLSLRREANGKPHLPEDVVYHQKGVYCTCFMDDQQSLVANVSFTAFGRERFEYMLPPARQLRSVAVTLNLSGVKLWTIPDDSLQPIETGREQIRWAFQNLVSDRRITVLIPGAQAPLARVLLLLRLVAVAVLLFGAGFWFLSEQVKPGQLDGFRLGHFLLLALTYSLFFAVFAVLEFHGKLETFVSMTVAAVFSLPLLVLHVTRVLDLRFASTRVVPLAVFTLGIVVNGVYGGPIRDYVFLGAAILVMAYVTVSYERWAAGREKHRQEQEANYAARRRELLHSFTADLGAQMADLSAAEARAEKHLQLPREEELAPLLARLEAARESVRGLHKDYEGLRTRLSTMPTEAGWENAAVYHRIERDIQAFRDQLEPCLERLRAELVRFEEAVKSLAPSTGEGEVHCIACGRTVPEAPFCQQCGSTRPAVTTCVECGERIVIPLHLLAQCEPTIRLFCTGCGARVTAVLGAPRASDPAESPHGSEGI